MYYQQGAAALMQPDPRWNVSKSDDEHHFVELDDVVREFDALAAQTDCIEENQRSKEAFKAMESDNWLYQAIFVLERSKVPEG